jgi:hypothetical protein
MPVLFCGAPGFVELEPGVAGGLKHDTLWSYSVQDTVRHDRATLREDIQFTFWLFGSYWRGLSIGLYRYTSILRYRSLT